MAECTKCKDDNIICDEHQRGPLNSWVKSFEAGPWAKFVDLKFEATAAATGALHEHDPVNFPKHYRSHPSGVECIQVVEHMNFCRGNAIKYIWRAGEKGNEIEDLRKAIWYLEREIKRLEK